MKRLHLYLTIGILFLFINSSAQSNSSAYPIVDTEQLKFFNNTSVISEPGNGQSFYGQDANYNGNQPSYTDNGDGTITDNVTGLMWQKSFSYMSWSDAESVAAAATTGGYTDWRVPTIKELYSLILFSGNQGSGNPSSPTPPSDAVPFVNSDYFDFEYPSNGRYIDVQYISSTEYTWTTMDDNDTFFGLNLADGRIKGYPQNRTGGLQYYARFVRGGNGYGVNNFVDNNDNTITDESTGLMWTKLDSGSDEFSTLLSGFTNTDGSLNWEEALVFAENLEYAGYNDWRLPNAKELHSILDYSRSTDATSSPAIDPIFETTPIINEDGQNDYPAFWSSTTFNPGSDAVLIFFGRALGYMNLGNGYQFYDVHGAGAQRTDPKTGEPTYGFGPQGDVRRVYNYVRVVRDAEIATGVDNGENSNPTGFGLEQNYPNPFNPTTTIKYSIPIDVKHETSNVKLVVFDILGNEVATLVNETKAPGNYEVQFDAVSLASGMYIYRISVEDKFTAIKKMLMLK